MRTFTQISAFVALALCAVALSAAPTAIGSINQAMVDQTVTIQGTVVDFQPSNAERTPHRTLVRDESGSVTVVFWQDIDPPVNPMPAVGAQATITGRVNVYRNQVQIRCTDGSGVVIAGGGTPIAESAAPALSNDPVPMIIGELTPLGSVANAQARELLIEGEIKGINPSRSETAPHTLTVGDSTGEMPVVIWPDVWDLLRPAPEVGNTVRIRGRRADYRGTVQVACRDANNLVLTDANGTIISMRPGAAPAPEAAAPTAAMSSGQVLEITLAEITGDHVGQKIHFSGQVVSVRPSWSANAPNILTVTDGTSTIPVVIWNDDYNALPHPAEAGNRFTLTGNINLYEARNEIQIVPDQFTYNE